MGHPDFKIRKGFAIGDGVSNEGYQSSLFKRTSTNTSGARGGLIPLKSDSPQLSPKKSVQQILAKKSYQSQASQHGGIIKSQAPNSYNFAKRFINNELPAYDYN